MSGDVISDAEEIFDEYDVPVPSAFVFHPVNIYPVLVAVANDISGLL